MRTKGKLVNASRSLEGDLLITLSIEDIKVSEIENMELSIDIEKYSEPKGLKALRYLWKLCTLIAQAVGSDKDTIYLMELGRYGDFADVEVIPEALEGLKRQFRFIEVLEESYESVYVRCYFGVSTYTKEELRHLLDGVVSDAEAIGIETWSREEIDSLIKNWRGTIEGH